MTQMVATQGEYYFTVVYQKVKYEFSIDAYSGAFRSWNVQPIG
jgi:hypothetical protein